MNKKEALKRKKLINQIRHHRVLPSGRVLTHDGRESLLGNLAPVKQIPMLPWREVIVFPTGERTISVATTGKNAWFYEMLKKYSSRAHDLIGFTPTGALDEKTLSKIGTGSVGIAVQVRKIEEPDADGRAKVYLKGICRYENVGLASQTEDYFCINVRWFEDNREADALVRPKFEKCINLFSQIADVMSGAGYKEFDSRLESPLRYDFQAVQYLSFSMIHSAQDHFELSENLELLLTRSTAKRFEKLNEYVEEMLAETERRFAQKNEEE